MGFADTGSLTAHVWGFRWRILPHMASHDLCVSQGLAAFAHRAHAEMCQSTGGFSGRFCRLLLPLRHSYMLQKVVQKHPSLSGKEFGEALVEAMAQRVASRFAVQAQSPAPAPTASADDDLMVPDFLVVSQLLQHETQVAVVHSQVTFCDDAPVKGKDPLLMSCGFRR